MAYWHYDRLSALDSTFLAIEDANVHMHVGAVALFETGPLANSDGTLAFDRVRDMIAGSLESSPRFVQKLSQVPVSGDPIWVDDRHFNLSYHVRHTSLPRPGTLRMLKRLAGRIFSQKLDRSKPLWEMWIVEGVEDGQFGVIAKAHHCMVDGISGFDLFTGMLRLDPDPTLHPAPERFPRPAPSAARLLAEELRHRASLPLSLLAAAPRSLQNPLGLLADAREMLASVREALTAGLQPTLATPLNADIGPYRRFDWARTEIAAVKEVRSHCGGTLNDVVLATAAGAIGRFLRKRGLRTDAGIFRAQVPVSIRTPDERGEPGNRVVMLMAELPIDEHDPIERLRRVSATMQSLKRSRQRSGVELLERVGDRTVSSFFLFFARLATWQRSFNVVVTNVPGPQRPAYLLGARMRAIYPLVPLAFNQGLGIALFSYDGALFWGFHSDWDALPDVHDLVEYVDEEFEALHKAAVSRNGRTHGSGGGT